MTCPKLTQPENGAFIPKSCSETDVEYGTRCVFYCYEGYEKRGPRYTTCQSDRTWSESDAMSCVRGESAIIFRLTSGSPPVGSSLACSRISLGRSSCFPPPYLVFPSAISRFSHGHFWCSLLQGLGFTSATSRASLVIVSCLVGLVSCCCRPRLVLLSATSRAPRSRLVFLSLSCRVYSSTSRAVSATPRVTVGHFSYFCRPCLVCLLATSRSSWSRLVFLWLSSRVSVGHFSCFSVTSRVSLVIVSCCYRPPIVVLSSVFVFVSYFPRLVWLGQLSCLAF